MMLGISDSDMDNKPNLNYFWKLAGKKMDKLIHAQTLLFEKDMIELKKKTGEKQTQVALSTAVKHYLECNRVGDK